MMRASVSSERLSLRPSRHSGVVKTNPGWNTSSGLSKHLHAALQLSTRCDGRPGQGEIINPWCDWQVTFIH